MDSTTKAVPLRLNDGAKYYVEATVLSGPADADVADREEVASFKDVSSALEDITTLCEAAIRKACPKKATVELGMEIGVESGRLTALFVKGTGKANFKITLEWENDAPKDAPPADPPGKTSEEK